MALLASHLRVLGLSEGATLEDATAAYKDLIRVWHPDRFQSDPKLRAKAEAQTKSLNEAIAFIRNHAKNPPPKPQPSPPPPRNVTTQRGHKTNIARAEPHPVQFESVEGPPSLPTINIHVTPQGALYQIATGIGLVLISYLMMTATTQTPPMQGVFAVLLFGCGFSVATTAATLLALKKPVIAANSSGVEILGAPRIALSELADAQSRDLRRGPCISFLATPQYLARVPLQTRMLMRLRYLIHRAHFEVRSNFLDCHPSHIVHTLNLALYLGTDSKVRPTSTHRARRWITHTQTLAMFALIAALLMCLASHNGNLINITPLLALFATLRLGATLATALITDPQ